MDAPIHPRLEMSLVSQSSPVPASSPTSSPLHHRKYGSPDTPHHTNVLSSPHAVPPAAKATEADRKKAASFIGIMHKIGFSKTSPPIAIFISTPMYILLNVSQVLLISQIIPLRNLLPYCLFSLVNMFDFCVMLGITRWYSDCLVTQDSLDDRSTKIINDGRAEWMAFCVFLMLVQIPMYIFVKDERDRVGDPMDAGESMLVVMAMLAGWAAMSVHILIDSNTYNFLGKYVSESHGQILSEISSRRLTFAQALRRHRDLNHRTSPLIQYVSSTTNVLLIIAGVTHLSVIYDYFCLPWSHWYHIFTLVFFGLGMCTVLMLNWRQVNYVGKDLVRVVAEGVGGEYEEELWNAEQRSQFLIYLRATEIRVTFLGKEAGRELLVELVAAVATAAFVVWQLRSQEGWEGLSFDQEYFAS